MVDVRMLGGHKEWAQGRKIDPRYDMDWMRGRVKTRLAPVPTPAPTPEDDVDLTDRINLVKNAKTGERWWAGQIMDVDNISVGGALGYAAASLHYTRDALRALTAQHAASRAAIGALAKALAEHAEGVDPEAFAALVRAESEAGAKAALDAMPLAAVLVRQEQEQGG